MIYGLNEDLFKDIIEVFVDYEKVEQLILYGSRAKGNYKVGSDIDLSMVGKDLSLQDILNIKLKLENLNLPYDIDLSIYDKIENKELIEHIKRLGIVVYQKVTKEDFIH